MCRFVMIPATMITAPPNVMSRPTDRLAVEEQDPAAEDERHQRQPEGIVAPERPIAATDRDTAGQPVAAGHGHPEPQEELTDPARRTAGTTGSRCLFQGLHAGAQPPGGARHGSYCIDFEPILSSKSFRPKSVFHPSAIESP
jgi:hypothetical protein